MNEGALKVCRHLLSGLTCRLLAAVVAATSFAACTTQSDETARKPAVAHVAEVRANHDRRLAWQIAHPSDYAAQKRKARAALDARNRRLRQNAAKRLAAQRAQYAESRVVNSADGKGEWMFASIAVYCRVLNVFASETPEQIDAMAGVHTLDDDASVTVIEKRRSDVPCLSHRLGDQSMARVRDPKTGAIGFIVDNHLR